MIKIQSRPQLGPVDALAAVREHFALDGTLTALPGERDRNFLLDATDGSQYVVKVSSPDETDEMLDIEVDLMMHVARSTDGFTPSTIATPDGDYVVKYSDGEDREHRVRVIEYLPGGLLADVRPRSTALLRDLGRRVAELDSALGAYPDHPPARLDFD